MGREQPARATGSRLLTGIRRLFGQVLDRLREWIGDTSLYSWKPPPASVNDVRPPEQACQHVGRYLVLHRPGGRIGRVALAAVAYLGLAASLILYFGTPAVPYRGAASWLAHWASLIPAVLLFVLLLLWVVDETRLFQRLVEHLSRTDTLYPPETVARFSARLNLPAPLVEKYLGQWLDIQLIADRSRFISKLVYYPFIIIAILVLARSPLIDNWNTSFGLGLVVLLGFCYAAYCALSLRAKAEEARSLAVARMTRAILHAKGDPNLIDTVVDQLETLLGDIRTIRQGAFMPLSQQPVFKAALVPLGSYGAIETAQYLLFAMR